MLFFAEITIRTKNYDGGGDYKPPSFDGPFFRLVEAASPEEAKGKAEAAFTRDDPYGTDVSADVVIHEVIR